MVETAIVTAGTTLLLGGGDTVSNDLRENGPLNATVQAANNKAKQTEVAKSLISKGVSSKKADGIAEAIVARLNGQELTRPQRNLLSSALESSAVRDTISEFIQKQSNGIDSVQNSIYDGGKINGFNDGEEVARWDLPNQRVDVFGNDDYATVTEDSALHQLQNASSEGNFEGGIKAIDNAIPNVKSATINPRKLTEYALNPHHPVGGNKAKVFESALGYNQSNADALMRQIYEKLPSCESILGKVDQYGQRYTVDIPITGPNGNTVNVRTGWITKTGSDIPELTTIYVKD